MPIPAQGRSTTPAAPSETRSASESRFTAASDSPRPERWHVTKQLTSFVRARRVPRPLVLDAEPGRIEIDLAATALLVVDLQNDFLHPGGWFSRIRGADVGGLHVVIEPVNRICAALRRHAVPIVHLNWGVRPDALELPASVRALGSDGGRRPGYADRAGAPTADARVLVAGEWGARTIHTVRVESSDITVHKHRLSGFHDNELDSILRRLGVSTLLFAGVNTDRCVFATLAEATFAGYDAVLIEDACASVSPASVTDAIGFLVRELYGFAATHRALLQAIEVLDTDGAMSSSEAPGVPGPPETIAPSGAQAAPFAPGAQRPFP